MGGYAWKRNEREMHICYNLENMFLKTQRRQQRNGLTGEKVLNKAIIF